MAIKILDETRRPGAPLGVRVDDAIRARREARRAGAGLRVLRSTSIEARESAEVASVQTRGASTPAAAARPCVRVRPKNDAPIVRPGARDSAQPERTLDTAIKTDPMFDADVEQARTLATTVRESVRKAARPIEDAAAQQAQPRKLRLTLRGQRVLVALGFALSIALGALVGTVIGQEPLPEQTATVVVKPGDSLWSIAEAVSEPGHDLRPVMEQIAALNGLQSPTISSGQSLIVPAG